MRPFEFTSPATREQAVRLLSTTWGETEILAGGTDLVSLMKDDVARPGRLVNIKNVDELKGIRFDSKQGLRLGSLITVQELLDNSQVQKAYPALWEAAEGIRSPQIASTGTVGGDLCQRPRCWYFRNGFGLLAMTGDGVSLVLQGDNRHHAILGNSGPAYFVHPSSFAPPFIAYGATVRVFGPEGERDIPVEKFFHTPTSNQERETTLKPNEFVTEILLPPPDGAMSATYEIRQREALDWPLATASVSLQMRRNKVQSARVVMGHVAPIPWLSFEAANVLEGKRIDEEVAEQACKAAVKPANSLGGNGYKIQLARVAVKRAVLRAWKRGL